MRKCVMAAIMAVISVAYASASRIDTLVVDSKMGKQVKSIVALPYDGKATRSYPVVYLLHGMYGDYTDWSSHTGCLDRIAAEYGVIIVCPDGENAFYFDSPLVTSSQYETYVTQELLQAVDSKYPTIATREGRAITGLSMGGHGALWLAWRHKDLYRACGSMSGAVDIATGEKNNKYIERLIGTDPKEWESHSVTSLVPTLRNGEQAIIITEGNEDFLYEQNMRLHGLLREAKIDHYFVLSPGGHTWEYWTSILPHHLRFFKQYLP